jgi:dCTP deaminase
MAKGSYLVDSDIAALAADGNPLVSPYNPDFVQAASVDLCLSGDRYEYTLKEYRLGDEIADRDCRHEQFDLFTLDPHCTAHVGLIGKINIPNDSLGWVFPRSSLTRLGLRIAPVFMNPGYSGLLPVTITNAAAFPIILVKGVRVGQLICARLATTPTKTYPERRGKYVGETVSRSKLHEDAEIKAALQRVLGAYFTESVVKAVT